MREGAAARGLELKLKGPTRSAGRARATDNNGAWSWRRLDGDNERGVGRAELVCGAEAGIKDSWSGRGACDCSKDWVKC